MIFFSCSHNKTLGKFSGTDVAGLCLQLLPEPPGCSGVTWLPPAVCRWTYYNGPEGHKMRPLVFLWTTKTENYFFRKQCWKITYMTEIFGAFVVFRFQFYCRWRQSLKCAYQHHWCLCMIIGPSWHRHVWGSREFLMPLFRILLSSVNH